MLPVSSLKEPPPNVLEPFTESLMKKMIENPTGDVQPILCVVELNDGNEFDRTNLESMGLYTEHNIWEKSLFSFK